MPIDISCAQPLINGHVEFHTSEERKELLKLAKAQRVIILSESGDKPATVPNGTVNLVLEPTEIVHPATLGLGMSESDYLDKLDDIIMRLEYGDEPSEADLSIHEEFEALPDDTARSAWIDKLSIRTAEDGRKARAAVVVLLQEHGIDDYETLSLVNRIGNPAAVKLASLLVFTDRSLNRDAFRQSADVRTFVDLAKAHPVDLDDDSKTSIPGLPARKFNEAIYRGIIFDPDALPAAFARALHDARGEVACRLGAAALPAACGDSTDNALKGLVDSSGLSKLIPHDDDGVVRVTPASVRDGFLKAALEKGANKLLADKIFEYASEHGLKLSDARPIVDGLLARTPNLIRDIVACHTPGEATAILDSISADAGFLADMAHEHAIGAVRAVEAGYLQSELPMLSRTYALCIAAGMGTEDALAATIDPESKPRRLARYGGRFTQSTESFSKGLELLEKFGEWFANACRPSDKDGVPASDNFNQLMKDASFAGTVERFAFEEIAVNEGIPIDADNLDDVFGMAKNPATGFIGRISDHTLAHAVTRMSPAMRGLVYDVFDTINKPAAEGIAALDTFDYHDMLISRTLANYASLASLRAAGTLNRGSIISVLFPETFGLPTETNSALMDSLTRVGIDVEKLTALKDDSSCYKSTQDFESAKQAKSHAYKRLQASGAPVPMFASLLDGGMAWAESIPISSRSTFDAAGMRAVGNPVLCEREAMRDLVHFPTEPTWKANWTRVVPEKNNRFVFRFADGTQYVHPPEGATSEEIDQVVDAVADKIAKLCGNVHHEQLSAVYRALSSEGGAPLVNAFLARGISTDARCPLVQTITRDATTGTISIVHSNPEGFPFDFTWPTDIAINGTVINGPITVTPGSTRV